MNLWPFRRVSAAIPMPDQSISVRDAARVLAASRCERDRAKVRETCRELCRLSGKPVPKALEN